MIIAIKIDIKLLLFIKRPIHQGFGLPNDKEGLSIKNGIIDSGKL